MDCGETAGRIEVALGMSLGLDTYGILSNHTGSGCVHMKVNNIAIKLYAFMQIIMLLNVF